MTTEIIEIKAMSTDEAKKRAMRVLDIQENQILNVVEKLKSKSFFGFFAKEGTYEVEYTEEKISEEKTISKPKNIARDLRKERAEKQALEKKKEEVKEVLEEEKKEVSIDNEKVTEILEKSKELLENMGLNLDVEFLRMDGKNYIINLSGEDKGIIIGKKGKTLNSFEYLLNSLIKNARIDIDVEGFKEKRTDTLVELANKMAMKAIKTKRVVRLNPMPPRERKIIHEIINRYPELDTFSEGRDPKRYIVIKRKK
ncbi:R3H domain-containing nucleic acid-binding protein [Fusobacterium sp.]|uniref:Jag family protein n=1 Tax=Fusobacterium sp. TaxID=68766 RepID=UPI0026025249|nr:R3H domain-containing nucleic acid-binding protein [Fusobacterium sp.]